MSNWSATRSAVSIVRRVAPVSSCTFSPQTCAPIASRIASSRDDEPRPSRPTFTGYASMARSPRSRTHADPRPTPHIGPASCPMIVVTPEEISASNTRGLSVCTCVSMPPAVAMSPSPSMTTVPVPTTMSMSSEVSGLPALPMPLMRPSRMPMLATRTPSTASSTTTLVISTSHDSRAESALSPIPSRPVLAKPTRISSPSSGTRSRDAQSQSGVAEDRRRRPQGARTRGS